MRKLAFLEMEASAPFPSDDHLVFEPLREAGFEVTWVPWQREGVDWGQFEMVVIRATYDYVEQPSLFLDRLTDIEASGVRLANSSKLVRWNIDKTYLLALAEAGIPVVPTRLVACLDDATLRGYRDQFQCESLVFKPAIGSSSYGILVWEPSGSSMLLPEIEARMAARAYLVQPFLESIRTFGEYSLFYFGESFSHAVVKRPRTGDFRVQTEFGGTTCPVEPPVEAVALAERCLAWVNDPLLYARVDVVQTPMGCLLMELELVEPQLFLGTDPQAPAHFALAIQSHLDGLAIKPSP